MIVTCPFPRCGRKYRVSRRCLGRRLAAPCGHTQIVALPDTGPAPPPQAGDALVGAVLGGKYRLLRPLGQGGVATVYQAWDRLLARPVAVKLVRPDRRDAEPYQQCLLAEAVAAGRVQHPNLVTVFDVVTPANGAPYLVLECLDGGSVADLLRDRVPLPSQKATRLAADACRGLRAMHRAGLIHLDIKPPNLLLSRRGVLKVADFGLAAAAEPTGRVLAPVVGGTPGYFSPEQAWSQLGGKRVPPLDHRTDLYSLGATYYEMLTGRRPFEAATVWDYACLHLTAPVPDPRDVNPDVPAACAAIVHRAMAKEPAGRYADAGEMLADLEQALAQ